MRYMLDTVFVRGAPMIFNLLTSVMSTSFRQGESIYITVVDVDMSILILREHKDKGFIFHFQV